MKSRCRLASSPRCVPGLLALLTLSVLNLSIVRAQAPPVPPVFQDLYSSLNTYLINFNATLGSNPPGSTIFTGNLKNANSNAGPRLVNSGSQAGILLQINELKAMGARAIMVQVGFPMLYEPFLTSQGQSYTQFVSFYRQVAADVRAAGLKLIVENDTLLTNDVQSGWDAAPFYATLDWTQYQQARAQTALTIAQTMQPDYIVVLQEPTTEANDSGQTEANTPSGSAALLSQILVSVQQSGVAGLQVGAGTGTAQVNALSFIQQYVALPVDFIDIHIYPINRSYLPIALQIATTAAAAGKPVAMTECWMWKVRDNELGVLTNDQARARDPFDFWAPLDAYFIQTIENLANHTQMLFMDPFGTEYMAAYLPYDSSTENLTPTEILNQESAQASLNIGQAIYTSTAMSYYASLVSPRDTIPPGAPTGVNGVSANSTTMSVNWVASADNVGVAGYYILRDGSQIATTANLYYQDSGLIQSTTYSYAIEAFDLAGNISVASQPIYLTTRDVTPPTVPGSVVAVAVSSERVNLTWSPSTDNIGLRCYLVFWGISPAVIQEGRTPSTITKYTSYPLTAGTTYYYGVEAMDTSGNTSPMSPIVAVTTPKPPAAPAGFSAVPVSATKIGLSWSAAVSGGLPVQYYHVYRGSSAANISEIILVAQTSYTDKNLNPTTTYYYAVQASDTGGDLSPMSAIVRVTTPAAPSAPAGLLATPIATTKIKLTWSAAASGGLPIQNYRVSRGTTRNNLSQVAIVLLPMYTDPNGSPATLYYYAVEAADTGGDLSPMSATVSATTLALPSAPTNLIATAISKTAVSLAWTAGPSGMPLSSYSIYRAGSSSGLVQIGQVAATKTAFTDYQLTAGTIYDYAVQAIDTGGNTSPMSAVVKVTTPQ